MAEWMSPQRSPIFDPNAIATLDVLCDVEGLRIIGLCIVAAIAFGVTHDLFSVAVCPEYLGIHHRSIGTQSPVLLAFAWGFLATWWFGVASGLVFAVCCRVGELPQLSWFELKWPIVRVLTAILVLAILTWLMVYLVSGIFPSQSYNDDRLLRSTAVMHKQSYLLSGIATISLAIWIVVKRYRRFQTPRVSVSVP